MIYISNEFGHYFVITPEAWQQFDLDYLQRAGCDIHLSKNEMYEAVVVSNGLTSVDEVEGNEITISVNAKGELVETCSRGIQMNVGDSRPDEWLSGYQL